MIVTKLTYRCDRESLGVVTEEAFVEAMTNELHAIPHFQEAAVEVEFGSHTSGLHSVRGFELGEDPVAEFYDQVGEASERAFNACVAGMAWSRRCDCYNGHSSNSGRCMTRWCGTPKDGVFDPTRKPGEAARCKWCRTNCN